ncbi:MAG: HAMP domain-containing methyl-accepting chemotaxis protein [Oleibacter sp.]|nr:HAMP domain-containing methyl-accepting chemotaxis protein [Thalassolituus sp.]
MSSRDTLRLKFEGSEDVLEMRTLRGDAVNKLYGSGFEEEKSMDDMDRRALAGESLVFMEKIDGERRLTVIEPYIAVEDRNGTNCLTCHQVEAGTILGAGRVTYSMANKDAQVEADVWRSFIVNILVVVAGLLCIYWVMYRTVIKPLAKLESTMTHIGDNSDLRVRVKLERNDEFLNVETAINKMLVRFQPTIHDLSKTMNELASSSGELATITRETRDGMTEQQKESGELAKAIDELARAAEKVTQSAINAEQVAASAKGNAEYGNEVVVDVASSINELAKGVEDAVRVVKELASDTQSIGKVSQSINEIAEQTNLLALNAAIEAARAGEQGRGFAVVADEVRSLATRTQESTKEINSIIERLVNVSEKAVQVMDASKIRADQSVSDAGRAGDALQKIASGVENICK